MTYISISIMIQERGELLYSISSKALGLSGLIGRLIFNWKLYLMMKQNKRGKVRSFSLSVAPLLLFLPSLTIAEDIFYAVQAS